MITTLDMADFILSNIPCYRTWEPEIFLGWLKWNEAQGFIQRAFDLDDKLVGLSICRPLMHPNDADEHYKFDPEGSVIYVEAAAAKHPQAVKALTVAGLKRFGVRDWIAWKRPPYYVTRFHDMKKYLRLVLRKVTV